MISFSYPMQVYEECVHSSGLQFHIQILKRKMCPFSCPTQMFKKNVCILLGNTYLEQHVCSCQHGFKENVCIFLPKHILRGMCTFPRASLTKYNSYVYTVILQKMGSFSWPCIQFKENVFKLLGHNISIIASLLKEHTLVPVGHLDTQHSWNKTIRGKAAGKIQKNSHLSPSSS